jgi:hypothetical protein
MLRRYWDHSYDVCNVEWLLVFACGSSVATLGTYVGHDVSSSGDSDTCDLERCTCVVVIEGRTNKVLEVSRREFGGLAGYQQRRLFGHKNVVNEVSWFGRS